MKTPRFYIIGFGLLLLFDTVTQVAIKLSSADAGGFVLTTEWLREVSLNPWVYAAIAGYLGSFVTWMTLLKHAPVGPAFAASHLDVVSVLAISVLYFGEQLSLIQVIGVLSIVLGIVCLSMSKAEPA